MQDCAARQRDKFWVVCVQAGLAVQSPSAGWRSVQLHGGTPKAAPNSAGAGAVSQDEGFRLGRLSMFFSQKRRSERRQCACPTQNEFCNDRAKTETSPAGLERRRQDRREALDKRACSCLTA